jgi:predicted hydrocarbon binding protein
MHGIIFAELRRFAEERLGPGSWLNLLETAGRTGRLYPAFEIFPDEEATRLFELVAQLRHLPLPELLEEFGTFIIPSLMHTYGALAHSEWRTLELLQHIESTIHRVVRIKNPRASPPELDCERTGPDEVTVCYTSQRRLCGLARGLIRGLAAHYHETVELDETRCMLRGDPCCLIVVRRVS